jgi:hypothetical protein
MNPLESQHHLRKDEWSQYREGCILDRPVNGDYSWVNIGLIFYRKILIVYFISIITFI